MKVKKLLLATSVALLSLSASAANPEDVRIYINPGHGTYTSSDRPMATIKHGAAMADTAGFYESNTNMQKAYGLLDKLKEYGVPYNASKPITGSNQTNIRMSHATTGISPGLSTVAAEAQTMNADVFISIHSNANQGDGNNPSGHTNFNQLLFLHRGWDGDPYVAGSDKIARACWNHAIKNKHMHYNWLTDPRYPYDAGSANWGNASSFPGRVYYPSGKDADGNPYWIKGDVTFQYNTNRNNSSYTRYYAVLNHSIPGFLVEGYDHTYRPAMHRAMNDDVCRHEGEMYARGLNDYFGWGIKDSYGKIYGIVRDQSVTMNHTYWSVIQNPTRDANKYIDPIDNKKPLNNVTVTLYNSNGVAVDTYTTDDEWNGAYFFKKVAPGTYTIKHSLNGYTEVSQTVTVVANETNYIDVDMRTSDSGVPVQGHYAYGLNLTKNDEETYTASFKSTGVMSNGKLIFTNSSTKEQTVIETGAIKKGSNTITIDATKFAEGVSYTWAVAFDNPASGGYSLVHNDNSVVYSGAVLGLAIDNDETSANFGNIYTNTGLGQGIQRFNPDLSKNGSKVLSGYFGMNGYANRLTVYGGKVYVANSNSTNPGVWVYNPSAATATTTNILANEVNGVAFYGEGANRKMYTINGGNREAYGYNIGASDTKQSTASTTFSNIKAKLYNDGDIIATDKGLFVSQRRYRVGNNSTSPAFMLASYSDVINYTSEGLSSTLPGTERGGMALSKDQKTFAIVDGWEQTSSFVGIEGDIELEVYSVSWNGNKPSFTHQYTIPLSGTHRVDQLAFDHANNLYIASREQGLLVYAIKNPSRQTVTNGSGTITGVNPPIPLYIVGNSAAIGNWDPAKAVEFTDNGKNYTITLDENVTEFKISTGKGETSGDWTAFDAGNLTTNDAITNGGTINLIAQHSYNNFVLPWAGVWNITVSGDLSTLTATTTTPKPLPPLYIVGNTAELGAWNTENAVEVANDGTKYTVTLNENVTAFKISTNKGDATTFNNGNLTPGGAITNGGTLNLIADKDGGNIALPWEGVWNVTIAGDLSTLHASTSTPNPDEGPGIGPEPEDAPNPDAEPTETDEAEDAQTEGYFAYALSSSKSGNEYTFSFKSTGARKNGRIVLTNTSTGATTEIKTPIVAGQNTVTINAYDIAKGTYTWAVKMTNKANSTVTQVGSDNSIFYNNGSADARIGVAIDNDQTSANFGTIYTMTAMGQGLQKYNPDMTKNGSKILTGMFGQDTSGSSSNKYKRTNRLEVNGGKVYVANYANSTYKGIWVYDPTASTATATSVESTPLYERGIGFYGTGSSRKAFVTTDGSLRRYDIGTSSSWAQSGYAANYDGVMINGDGDVITTANGIIVSQHRFKGNNTASVPAFAVFDHNLNLITTSGDVSNLNGSQCGGMALSPDNKTFAIVDAYTENSPADINVQVYNLTWSGSTPTFTYQYSIPLSGTQQVDQMEFDHAGNLYIASQQKGLLKYAVKTSARVTTTNALSSYTITGLGRDVAPSNVVAIRKCYGEGSNTTAGTVDADITWTGEAGEYKVYYQTMRRDASGNRVEDNSTWVEAGTATIASGSTSGTFIHKNLAHGGDYDRIYNYKVANYYPAANYASELKSKAISGKGRTITSAAPHNPVNVTLSQPTEVKDGVTLYSFDVKLDLAPNTDVFNASLRDDNDELPTMTKYVIVVDEATAKVLNAASNVSEVGRFYQGPATMTANNCNHYVINDWYMVVDIDDVTPSDDLSKATKSLIWKNVNPLHSFQPQVYASAVRTFNFTATDASIPGNPDANALTMTLPSPQWISNQDNGSVGVVTLEGDYSSLVTTDDYPMGTFRKVGDIENPTNPVAITRANYIGSLGAMLQPLAVTDDIMGTRNANGVYENATWNIAYTFKLYEKNGEEWTLIREAQKYDQQSTDANVNSLYSNTSGLSFDITGMPVGADEVASPDGRKRLVYNPQKNKEYKLVVETNYRRYINGEQVHAVGVSENLITINPTFAAPSINATKSPGFLFMETTTHWDENCTTNSGYYKYYYDAAVDIAWNDFNDNLVRYMGYHATPKFECVGHPDGSSSEWTPYYAASLLTDEQVDIYNTRKGNSNELVLTKLGYSGKEDWSTMATEENHIPLKVHYVWAGNDKIADTGDAEFGFELSANYPIVSVETPEFKINEYPQSGAYEFALVNPLSRSTSGYELQMITSVNKEYKTLVMDGIIETPTTGVENVGTGNGALRLYPNPANSVVTLQAPITITDVKIFTVDGQLMKEFDADDTKVKINVSDLPTGVYIVHAAGSTTRLIKR